MLTPMNNETFGQRLKRLREAAGLTKYRLAKDSGINESYIYQLEDDLVKNPRQDTLKALAKACGVSVSELTGDTNPTGMWQLIETSLKAYMPVYAEVSAGEGIEAIDYIACTRLKPVPESLRAYRVRGLCLEPEIPDGSTIIVDTARQPDPGKLVVVIMDGNASVKRFMGEYLENNDGRCRPDDVQVHGVVIGVYREL